MMINELAASDFGIRKEWNASAAQAMQKNYEKQFRLSTRNSPLIWTDPAASKGETLFLKFLRQKFISLMHERHGWEFLFFIGKIL